MSVLEHKGQIFVSVFDDRVPAIRLENRTDRRMYVAQADLSDASKPSTPKKTLNDENFEWHTSIRPGSTICYTPPSVDAEFPEQLNDPVSILLACDDEKIAWSRPIRYDESSETYMELPYVKVSVDTSGRSVHIVIDSINQVDHQYLFDYLAFITQN